MSRNPGPDERRRRLEREAQLGSPDAARAAHAEAWRQGLGRHGARPPLAEDYPESENMRALMRRAYDRAWGMRRSVYVLTSGDLAKILRMIFKRHQLPVSKVKANRVSGALSRRSGNFACDVDVTWEGGNHQLARAVLPNALTSAEIAGRDWTHQNVFVLDSPGSSEHWEARGPRIAQPLAGELERLVYLHALGEKLSLPPKPRRNPIRARLGASRDPVDVMRPAWPEDLDYWLVRMPDGEEGFVPAWDLWTEHPQAGEHRWTKKPRVRRGKKAWNPGPDERRRRAERGGDVEAAAREAVRAGEIMEPVRRTPTNWANYGGGHGVPVLLFSRWPLPTGTWRDPILGGSVIELWVDPSHEGRILFRNAVSGRVVQPPSDTWPGLRLDEVHSRNTGEYSGWTVWTWNQVGGLGPEWWREFPVQVALHVASHYLTPPVPSAATTDVIERLLP